MDNPFLILGISPSASGEEIAAAWREKAKRLHPDLFQDVSHELQAAMTTEMARVNSAYQYLKSDLDEARRLFGQVHDFGANTSTDPPNSSQQSRSHTAHVRPHCELCGALNVQDFKFSRQVGLIFQRRIASVELKLCRSCALAVGRDFQSRTLLSGWWGLISFFANAAYVWQNSAQLRTANSMADPAAPVGYRVDSLDPGRPVWKRARSWPAPLIICGWLAFSFAYSPDDSTSTRQQDEAIADWETGTCVEGASLLGPIDCSEPHRGKIVSKTTSESECPSTAELFARDGLLVYCIDEDL
jgi:hypothetical protein